MKQLILAAIWVLATAIPALNAQQPSPSQSTATQQTLKPKTRGNQAFPQPRGQPTQATTASNNPGRDKRIANDPGHGKPPDNNPGHRKPAPNNPGNGKTTDNNTGRGNDNGNSYADAVRRYRHERHDHDWWKQRYIVIVLVGGGYYYWNAGYWYPAWGYDPNYERYDYDGPIYTYGNLLPDQVIINVQNALKALGYYEGDVNGSLGASTRRALSAYQQAFGLDVTGVVDEPTVRALGLI